MSLNTTQQYLLEIIINEYTEAISELDPLIAVRAYTAVLEWTRLLSPLRLNGVGFWSSQLAAANHYNDEFLKKNNISNESNILKEVLLDDNSPSFLGLKSRNDGKTAPITQYDVQGYVRKKINSEIQLQIDKMSLNEIFSLAPIHQHLAKERAIVLVRGGANLSEIDDSGFPMKQALKREVTAVIEQSLLQP